MYTVIYRSWHNTRHSLAVGDAPTLFSLLLMMQESEHVKEFKVINEDAGIVTDFYIAFGWGNDAFTKNAPTGFTWNDDAVASE